MTPKQILRKEAFTRLVPSDSLTCIGESKAVGSDSELAYSYESPSKMVMSQADFMREYDVNAHKINSIKYYPNAVMKGKEGKISAKIKSRIAVAWQKRILVKRLATLTGNNMNIRLSNSKRSSKKRTKQTNYEVWRHRCRNGGMRHLAPLFHAKRCEAKGLDRIYRR